MELYLVKLSCHRTQDNGCDKKVTETYLIEAFSCAEAEKKIVDEIGPYIKGDFSVTALKKIKISDVLNSDEEGWYKAKLITTVIDEKSLKEKKINRFILVNAYSFAYATKRLYEYLRAGNENSEVDSVMNTHLTDVFLSQNKE